MQVSRLTLTMYVLAGLAIVVVGALLVSEVPKARKRAVEAQEENSLRWAARAIRNNSYPAPQAVFTGADGEPLYSWRFLSHIADGSDQSEHWNASWDASVNTEFREKVVGDFCWSEPPYASIFAVTGSGTCFDDKTAKSWGDVPDDTLILVESNAPRVHWMQPRDISVEGVDRDSTASEVLGIDDDDFLVGFADGTAWRLSSTVPASLIANAARLEGEGDREKLAEYQTSKAK